MNLDLDEDQRLLAKSARGFLERECPASLVRELRRSPTGHSEDLWRKLADLGWLGAAFPEEFGGGGSTLFELGLFCEQAGRVLLPTSFAATIFAALVVRALGSDVQQRDFLGRVARGEVVASVALAEAQAIRDPAYLRTEARPGQGTWVVRGEKMFVSAAQAAGVLLVVARASGPGASPVVVLMVPPGTEGVEIAPHATFGGDPQAVVRLHDVALPESARLGAGGEEDAWAAVEGAALEATALQCMEIVGGAERVLEMTVEHVKQREQFGRPIGSFQAVQHHVADMATRVEGARWTAYQAAWRLSEGLPARREVAIGKAWCSRTYPWVTQMAHQLHGGSGFVLDHDLHLYSERAKATQVAFGGWDVQLGILARAIGVTPG